MGRYAETTWWTPALRCRLSTPRSHCSTSIGVWECLRHTQAFLGGGCLPPHPRCCAVVPRRSVLRPRRYRLRNDSPALLRLVSAIPPCFFPYVPSICCGSHAISVGVGHCHGHDVAFYGQVCLVLPYALLLHAVIRCSPAGRAPTLRCPLLGPPPPAAMGSRVPRPPLASPRAYARPRHGGRGYGRAVSSLRSGVFVGYRQQGRIAGWSLAVAALPAFLRGSVPTPCSPAPSPTAPGPHSGLAAVRVVAIIPPWASFRKHLTTTRSSITSTRRRFRKDTPTGGMMSKRRRGLRLDAPWGASAPEFIICLSRVVGALGRRPSPTPPGRPPFIMSYCATVSTSNGATLYPLSRPISIQHIPYIFITYVKLCYCIRPRFLLKCQIVSSPTVTPPFPLRSESALAPSRKIFVSLPTLKYVYL